MTAGDHCPTCGHRHQRGPAGRLVCGGDDGACKCDPADPCRCGVCEMARASRPERKPAGRWVQYRGWILSAGPLEAQIERGDGIDRYVWRIADSRGVGIGSDAWVDSLAAAKLAAEDALLAIAAEIVGAVGR